MKHILLLVVMLAAFSMSGFGQQVDTIIRSVKPNLSIPSGTSSTVALAIPGDALPYFAKLEDLDLYMDITHESINDLAIMLYAPINRNATVMFFGSCINQPVQGPQHIKATLNDQAYDIDEYNQTGQKIPVKFTCSSATPSIGAYNQGHMQPYGDQMKVFNTTNEILGGQCNVSIGFKVGLNDINPGVNRFTSMAVRNFIEEMGIKPGDKILLSYKKAHGKVLTGLEVNKVYQFRVLSNSTLELTNITGSDITAVPPGTQHEFIFQRDWLLVLYNLNPNSNGKINEVALHFAYVPGPCAISKQYGDNENLLPDQEAETRDELNEVPFIAFPNPFSDMLTVGRSADGLDGQLSIRSMDGRLIFGPVDGASIREVNTSGWSSGMYLAEWRDAREVQQVLVVKK